MASASVRVDAFDALPGVCAKTGRPTEIRMTVVADYVPRPLRWLQLFGVWAFLFARSASTRRRHVRLPISPEAFRRFRIWQVSCAAAFVVAVVAALVTSVTGPDLIGPLGWAVAAGSFALGARAQQRTWVGLNVDRRARVVTVTRCHPAFARAAATLRPRR